MSQPTTQTGIPIVMCDQCGLAHPVTRPHCVTCGKPTAFTDPDGECLTCNAKPKRPRKPRR